MVTLLKGCILFDERRIQVVDVESVERYSNADEADSVGVDYLDNGGDSYLVIENEDGIIWCSDTYEKYKSKLNTLN